MKILLIVGLGLIAAIIFLAVLIFFVFFYPKVQVARERMNLLQNMVHCRANEYLLFYYDDWYDTLSTLFGTSPALLKLFGIEREEVDRLYKGVQVWEAELLVVQLSQGVRTREYILRRLHALWTAGACIKESVVSNWNDFSRRIEHPSAQMP